MLRNNNFKFKLPKSGSINGDSDHNDKRVSFNEIVHWRELPPTDPEERTIGPFLFKQIFKQCDQAALNIINLINKNSSCIIVFTDPDDVPIRVTSDNKEWFNDDSVITLLKVISHSGVNFHMFLMEYESNVRQSIPKMKSGSVEYKSRIGNFNMNFPSVYRR